MDLEKNKIRLYTKIHQPSFSLGNYIYLMKQKILNDSIGKLMPK